MTLNAGSRNVSPSKENLSRINNRFGSRSLKSAGSIHSAVVWSDDGASTASDSISDVSSLTNDDETAPSSPTKYADTFVFP
jgi:hypothetical protein